MLGSTSASVVWLSDWATDRDHPVLTEKVTGPARIPNSAPTLHVSVTVPVSAKVDTRFVREPSQFFRGVPTRTL